MTVSGIVKSSLVDYPGLITCVLFVPGCNYDCFYCHNRSLLGGTREIMDLQKIQDFLVRRAGHLDGVVISGGEPTLQPGLVDYIQSIKNLGYKIKLDTNGSSPGAVASLLQRGLCDYYAVDYKAPAARYRDICAGAADAGAVLNTIGLLLESGSDFEVRTTVIAQLSEDDLICMARELPKLPRYVLNRYRKPNTYLPRDRGKIAQKPYTQEQIGRFAEVISKYQPNVRT